MADRDVDYKEVQRSGHIIAGVSMGKLKENLQGFDIDSQARTAAAAAAQSQASTQTFPAVTPATATQYTDKLVSNPLPLDPGIPLNPPVGGDASGGDSPPTMILVVTTGIENGAVATCNFYSDADPVPL